MSHFEADHRRRIDEASAVLWELLPSPAEELSQVRAEYRDGRLCDDSALIERTTSLRRGVSGPRPRTDGLSR